MSQRLSNYLRTYRKHRGLSQDEVARLIGTGHDGNVTRHENGERTPGLENALAYAAALQVPVTELFAGTYEKVESKVAERAQQLAGELAEREGTPAVSRKLETLETLAAPTPSQ